MHKLLLVFLCVANLAVAQEATRSSGWVVIPIGEYEALRSMAYPVDRAAEGPPLEATLTRLDYDLRLDGPLASGIAVLTIDVAKEGWSRIPIPSGLLVRDAKLNGKPLALVSTPAVPGQLSVLLSQKGRSIVTLELAFTVYSNGGEERLTLPSGNSGVAKASISFLPQDVEVKVTGGFVSTKSNSNWIAYARGSDPLTFTWRRKIEEKRVELPLRSRGSLVQLFSLGEDTTSLNAEAGIEILQGLATKVKILVPEAITINQVLGATVADWDVKAGELLVNFLEPVDRAVKFSILGETRLPRDGDIAVPILKLLEMERDSGGVAVEVLGAGEIKETKPLGLELAEAAELGPMVASRQSPSLAAFRIRAGAQQRSLNLKIVRYTQQAVLTANVEEARYRVIVTSDGKTLVQARYSVLNNQRNFLRITLPTGAVVWGSSVSGRPVRAGQGPDNSLLIPLSKDRSGDEAVPFSVEVLYFARTTAWAANGRMSLSFPAVDLPVSRTGLVIHYPPLFRVTPEAGAFSAQSFEPPTTDVLKASAILPPQSGTLQSNANLNQSASQMLVDGYRARSEASRSVDASPGRVTFPAVGPSIYLVSQLTQENKSSIVELSFQKEKKKGGK